MTKNPIPKHLQTQFLAYMKAANIDELPDGAWFAHLESSAYRFLKQHKLPHAHCEENTAVHYYLRATGEPT